ncbi:TPA: hypothetical protein QDB51_006615 [Burkholderia vietnamiensis]|nr:hypothetical protein [Burkholderia vietnamiensis]
MNIILIFKNDTDKALLERSINGLPFIDGQVIVKIIEGEDDEKGLEFDSYRHTFSPKSIELAKSLNLNREVWFNFDIDSSEKWKAVKNSGLSRLFVDFYVERQEQLDFVLQARSCIQARVDLNIIDSSVPFRQAKESNLFDNVDRYYSIESLMLERMEEKKLSGYVQVSEGEGFRNYVLDAYAPSMIYRYVGKNVEGDGELGWQIYLFGINRFFKTGLFVSNVSPTSDLERVRRWLVQRGNKQKACLFCDFKLGCLSNDTFFYFSEVSKDRGICDLKERLEEI